LLRHLARRPPLGEARPRRAGGHQRRPPRGARLHHRLAGPRREGPEEALQVLPLAPPPARLGPVAALLARRPPLERPGPRAPPPPPSTTPPPPPGARAPPPPPRAPPRDSGGGRAVSPAPRWKPDAPGPWVGAARLDPPRADLKTRPQLYNLDAVAYES